jgi:hypothetical protein
VRAALLISPPEPNHRQSSKLALSLAAAYWSGFGALLRVSAALFKPVDGDLALG